MNQTTIGDVIGNDNVVGSGIAIYNYNNLTSNIKLHDIESMTGESGTLRACLKSEEQAYIPLDDSWVENQLTTLITTQTEPNFSKPLVIKGFGGLGKTRLALEICRLAKTQYQAKTLLLNNAHADLTQLITEAKQQKQHLILLIDDCLEFFIGANKPTHTFDGLVDDIHHTGEGWVHLVVTLRYLPGEVGWSNPKIRIKLHQNLGIDKLGQKYCYIINLNEQKYQDWRIRVCEKIYAPSREYNIDIPFIATVANYYENPKKGLNISLDDWRENGRWLLSSLAHEFKNELDDLDDEYKLIYLLLLFPFGKETRDKLDKDLRKWLEALERTGFIYRMDKHYRITHKLLSDIALGEFLSSYILIHQRQDQLEQLIQDAQEIGCAHIMMSNLAYALRQIVAQNPLSEALDLLLVFGEAFMSFKRQEFQENSNEQWCQLPKQILCSLSLSLSEKIRVFERMPELSDLKIQELIQAFNDEVDDLQDFIINTSKIQENFNKTIDFETYEFINSITGQMPILYRFIVHKSYNNENWFIKITEILKQNKWKFPRLQLNAQLCRRLCLCNINTEIIMDLYYQYIIDLQLEDSIYSTSANSIFYYAYEKAKKENDISFYKIVWEQFGKDKHDEIRLQAAKAAFNYAWKKAKQENDGDISFYKMVWKQFQDDDYDEIRLQAAEAAWNYALEKDKQENDLSVYLTVWEQFGQDEYEHDEIRLQAAKAAVNYAIKKTRQEKDIGFFQQVWEQFQDDKYPPIQQQALSAKLEHVNWQIALSQAETAYQDGLALLNHSLLDKDNNAALHFLLWLAHPTSETQQACDHAVASLNGEATTWTFDEFAERIASFSDENQAYAKYIIGLLEQSTP